MSEKQSYLERPWVRQLEDRGLPVTLEPYPDMPLYRFLDDSVREFPDRPALDFMGMQMTWAELGREADCMAAALSDLGVKKGDRVGTILVNSPQFIIADFAILKCGAANVPCSPLHSAEDLEHELGSAGVETLFCMDTSFEVAEKVKEKAGIKNIIVTGLEDYIKSLPPEGAKGRYIFRELIADHDPRPPQVKIDPQNDLARVPFTGGATGIPKGVMLTHRNLVSNTMQTWGVIDQMEAARFLLRGNCAVLLGLPFFHSYGHWAMQSAVYMGWHMLLVSNPRDTDMILELMKKHRPLFNIGVPTQYMKLTAKKTGQTGVIGVSGSAALPTEVAEKYEEDAGAPMQEGYGLTETSPCTHVNLTGLIRLMPEREGPPPEMPEWLRPVLRRVVNTIGAPRLIRGATRAFPLLVKAANKREKKTGSSVKKKGSIGMPIFDTDCKLVDPSGDEVPFGESGEMWIKGPQVMKGYWPDAGAGLVDGWLPTGDVARMDEEGFFYIVDRIKDMINISGNKVYSRIVDEVLYQHPAVEMAAAIGIPAPERPGSERVKAFMSLKSGHDPEAVREEIITLCHDKLPPYAVPKQVEFREEFPLTVTEKIFKRKLREQEIEKMKAEGVLPDSG
jgi:acyl-CoA synthetase (AMP-forming)/AMP-acid ligase II